jgi:hypothetical protein
MRPQVEERCVVEDVLVTIHARGSSICPFAGNGKGPPGRSSQNEGLDGADFAGLENLKSLTTKRVKGMGDFRPSQILTVVMCCYLAP